MSDIIKKAYIFLFFLIFYSLWTLYVFFFYPSITLLESQQIINLLVNISVRILIWGAFILVYIKVFKIEFTQITGSLKPTKPILFYSLFGIVIYFALYSLQLGYPQNQLGQLSLYDLVSTVILVPIVEELMFRGLILSELQKHTNFNYSNFVTGIMFVLIHLPGWYFSNQISTPIVSSIIGIFALSLISGYLRNKTNSLIPSIVLHIFNNIFAVIIWRI